MLGPALLTIALPVSNDANFSGKAITGNERTDTGSKTKDSHT
jgi:hypothetical protein